LSAHVRHSPVPDTASGSALLVDGDRKSQLTKSVQEGVCSEACTHEEHIPVNMVRLPSAVRMIFVETHVYGTSGSSMEPILYGEDLIRYVRVCEGWSLRLMVKDSSIEKEDRKETITTDLLPAWGASPY
jgi:hypothetical protein